MTELSDVNLKLPEKSVVLELNQYHKKISITGLCNSISGNLVKGSFLMSTKMYCQDLMKFEFLVTKIVQKNLQLLATLASKSRKLFDGKNWIKISLMTN